MSGKRNRAFMKGNRLLSLAVVVLMAAAVVLTSVLILKQSFTMIFSADGEETGQASVSSAVSQQDSLPSDSAASAVFAASKGSSKASSGASAASSGAGSAVSVAASSLSTSSVENSSFFTGSLFVGDSITMGIHSYQILPSADIFATNGLSVWSSLTGKAQVDSQSLTLSAAVAQAKPKRIYLLLGSNDIAYTSQASFISNYGKLLDLIKKQAPSAKIVVQSIFPVSASYASGNAKYQSSQIGAFNAALKSLCAQKSVVYADVASVLKGADGNLNSFYAGSGINISKRAYDLWMNYLSALG